MGSIGRVVGGDYINATVTTNRKGELALNSIGLRRTPNLTREAIGAWEEVFPERRGGALNAISKVGQAVSLATLRGPAGKAASAAVGSTAEFVANSTHTIRVDWLDGKRSLIELPDKQFQHLAILLEDRRIQSAAPPPPVVETESPTTPGVIAQLTRLAGAVRPTQPDTAEQLARLAELRDQGVLTEAEFTAKKTELLGLDPSALPAAPAVSPDPPVTPDPPALPAAAPQPEIAVIEQEPTPDPAVAPPPPSAPAVWAPDPFGRFELRYWDGETWTAHVSSAGVQQSDPV